MVAAGRFRCVTHLRRARSYVQEPIIRSDSLPNYCQWVQHRHLGSAGCSSKHATYSSPILLFLAVFGAVNPLPGRGLRCRFRTTTGYSAGLAQQVCFIGNVQFKELTPRMGHAPNFGHTKFNAGFVIAKIIADQLALPALQEAAIELAPVNGMDDGIITGCRTVFLCACIRNHLWTRLALRLWLNALLNDLGLEGLG